MKLSDAIEKGATEVKQGFGRSVTWSWEGQKPYEACAIGAACVGCAENPFQELSQRVATWDYMDYLKEQCEIDLSVNVKNPISGFDGSLGEIVIYLNDAHHWSFDRMIGWLRSIGL